MASFSKSKAAGFTLIELMVAVAILGAIVAAGMPSFRQMLRSAEIRSVAESVVNGVQRARAEAVSRNTRVRFVLNSNAGVYDTAWNVWAVDNTKLDSRDANEGSGASTTITPLASDLATAASSITFNQLGQVIANADGSLTLSRVNVAAVGSVRNLRVTISAGGSARVCDPNMAAGSNARAC